MVKPQTPAERLIVAADSRPTTPNGVDRVKAQVLELADLLTGTEVYIKLESSLRGDYSLIDEIHQRGLRVFADLKLFGTPTTLALDGALLRKFKPELLTVACGTGVASMKALKAELPDTEVLGVTVLTSFTEEDAQDIYGKNVADSVRQLVSLGIRAGIDGFICSPHEVAIIQELAGDSLTINTPNIRSMWSFVPGDEQNPYRTMTPAKAMSIGADRIVVGRPITQARDPFTAFMWTLKEIASVAP